MLVPEPFVPVALIAPVRRILVITAEFGTLTDRGESAFRYPMIELGLLTLMTGALVTCLVGLRKRDEEAVAERAWAGLPAPGHPGAGGSPAWGAPVESTFEVTLVEAPATLRRKADPATGLAVTDVWGSAAVPER